MDTTTFSALAEPNRLHIVELLRNGPLTVGEIADQVGIRQPQASKHLRVLLDAGLVDVRVVANRRIYRLQQEPFQELNEWLETYKALWDERFDNLERYLKELQAKDKPSKE
ncbi:ArsR/SmtB family transcription factor [Paenibacillus enshidis]|uniref:ArsR/SmtB family transcription factor n=1 Tax=Paenibacillus enshidis TaxID=1458439 RepID=A0ABV5AVQ4_9BACL